ncbi:MAG TPA: NINE protein [Saprospiraceae bacterium]|nr:NINE protein [Saprospiraceae bacterium]
MKDKNVAGILALFLGSFGVHRFYLGQIGLGILYIILNVFFFFSFFLSLIDAIVFFSQDQDAFDLKYNKEHYKAVRKEKSDYQRNRRPDRPGERQPHREDRQPRRSPSSTASSARRRKPRHNPYKTSGVEKYREYDYDGAIKDFQKALEINERDVATHFNIACAYSLNENTQKAFYHLDRAVDLGFNDFSKIKEHDAFAYLRIQDGFVEFEENGFRLKRAAPEEVTEETQSSQNGEEEEKLNLPNDLLEQLNKLNELKNKGLLTEEEFAVQKEKLMK